VSAIHSHQIDERQIAAPGAIQGWGALLVSDPQGWAVRHASANLGSFLGVPAVDAIGRTLADLLGPAALARVTASAGDRAASGAYVAVPPRAAGLPGLVMTARRLGGSLFIEIEQERTTSGEEGERFARVRGRRVVQALRTARDPQDLFRIAVAELRRLTSFDRVHVYRFGEDGHGEVIAETHAPDMDPLLGLRFPGMYVPPVARRILADIGVRVIADSEAAPVPLLGDDGPVDADLSRLALRMTADCCRGFFRDMGLRASVSIALTVDGVLWGVLACHNRVPAFLTPETRGLCELVGQVTSLMLLKLRDDEARVANVARHAFLSAMSDRLSKRSADPSSLAAALVEEGAALSSLCAADGMILRFGGSTRSLGVAPTGPAADKLLDDLLARAPPDSRPVGWDRLGGILPDQPDAPGGAIAGALLLRLAHAEGEAIVWLRLEQARAVRWAGLDAAPADGTAAAQRAVSRRNFAVWQETVRGRSLPWTETQHDAARELRHLLEQLLAGYLQSMRLARETAERATRVKSMFLATMSHEIRSPLSGLLGVLELLRGTDLDDEQARMARMIHESGSTLLAVLNDVLDFSKIEAGAMTVTLEAVALREVVDGVVGPQIAIAAAKGLTLHASIDRDVPARVGTDALRLRQILNNLLSNALKFTRAGEIALRVERVAETTAPLLRFRVRDTGIGMDADVLGRLFRPFEQADGSTSRQFGGTGLGLSISRQLARLLGGDLTVVSTPNVGSEFTLDLPLLPAEQEVAEAGVGDAARATPIAAGKRVLVVDDDTTIRWLTKRQLEKLGVDADAADDGESGLRKLRKGAYDLLLTDCHMPRMDGVALTVAVRADPDPRLHRIPIIGLTADVTEAQREKCRAAGMTELAIKPVRLDGLAALLQRHLAPSGTAAAAAPAAPAPALRAVALDDQIYLSMFELGDPEGAAWLTQFLAAARQDVDALGDLLAAAEPPRLQLRRVAHRLAGAAFSAGAMLLGAAARTLEGAADHADPATLGASLAVVRHELAAAASAIDLLIGVGRMGGDQAAEGERRAAAPIRSDVR
jgi:light-regulated signal transduction histidine kinase (bacteriophytochrome)/FixJ family two-component response regulator/HPt (histidine-containing phosphotransfer) domain-containing protein